MSIQPAIYANWAEDLACDIIAAYCGKPFAEARKEIAARLWVVKETCDEAALARMRIAGRGVSDTEFDREVERREGWTV